MELPFFMVCDFESRLVNIKEENNEILEEE